MMKRIIATLLMLAMILAMIPTSFATDAAHSRVWQDLAAMEFDGESWDVRDYPADPSDTDVYVVAVDEVGFRKNGELSGYAFFLYLYNPSGKVFNFTNGYNKVQMAVAWDADGTPTEFEKFDLQCVSSSDEAGYNNVFLKLAVVDHASSVDGLTMKQRLNKSKSRRVYDISGVELSIPDGTITDYAYGCSVTVRGYDVGCGEGNEVSTKEITYVPSTTLTLDVQHAYWRTQTSPKGVNHKHQINSAYFTVPGEVWEQYKELYSIKCTWEEHNTTPMIVTDDQELYNELEKFLFVNSKNIVPAPQYSLYSDFSVDLNSASGIVPGKVYTSNYAYNLQSSGTGINRYDRYTCKQEINRLAWLFKVKNEIKLNEESVSAAEVLAFYEKYKYLGDPLFLADTVDEGREEFRNGMTIYLDTTFDLSNYDSNHNWFQKMIDYNWFNGGVIPGIGLTVNTNEVYSNFEPITVFEPGNGNGQYMQSGTVDPTDVKNMYYFNDNDQAQAFINYTQKAVENGDVVVLFRYASTDYFSESLTVFPKIDGHAYVATQTFFKNFDVIQLQFKKEDMSISTVAVVNDPDNVISGIHSPTTTPDSDLVGDQMVEKWKELFESMTEDMSKLFKWIFAAILLSALIPLVMKFFDVIFSNNGTSRRQNRPKGRQKGSTRRKKE